MKENQTDLDGVEAAWEAHLAAAWRAAAGGDEGGEAESAALARRLDAALRRERAVRRRSAWLAWGAAAACAALLAWGTARMAGRGGAGGGAAEVAEEAMEEEYELAEAREAPVAEAFEALDDMLWEMASVTLSYEWDDEDLESIN